MTDPTPKHSTIPLTPCASSKVHSYGYDATSQVLAVRFKSFKDGEPSPFVYEYPAVGPEGIAALDKAESKGNFVNTTFVKTKYPFKKLLAEAPAEST